MTRKALLLVHTNAAGPEHEAEFNTWYEQVHIPQLLESVPGIVRATRYSASPSGPPTEHRYLAIYEIEAENPASVLHDIGEAAAAGKLDMSPAMDGQPPMMALYEPTHSA